ncbi:MAG: lysozyme inhibitor LprI family protein [Shimia sp.]
MRRLAAFFALWGGAAVAQDLYVDTGLIENCLASEPRHACIGRTAAACIDSGGAGAVVGYCYGQELDYWDELLNIFYRDARDAARARDAEEGDVPWLVAPPLLQMQREWIAYRNQRCETVGALYGGGTGAGRAGTECRMRATAEQVFVLRDIAEELRL